MAIKSKGNGRMARDMSAAVLSFVHANCDRDLTAEEMARIIGGMSVAQARLHLVSLATWEIVEYVGEGKYRFLNKSTITRV